MKREWDKLMYNPNDQKLNISFYRSKFRLKVSILLVYKSLNTSVIYSLMSHIFLSVKISKKQADLCTIDLFVVLMLCGNNGTPQKANTELIFHKPAI